MIKEDKKLLILYILDILKKYTDDNHSLTYSQISEKLKQDYNVTPDPKTVSRTVSSLISYGADIKKHGNSGCSIVGSKFDSSELSFLIDAIFSSKSISSNHAKSLIENLMSDCSIYERKKYDYIYKADEIARSHNREFFFTIDTISRAIESGKQISFNYNEVLPNKKLSARFDGKEFLINPYFMINNHGTVIGDTKTACSVREVPIPDILIDALKDWKKEQWVKKQLTGVDLLSPKAIVFSNDDGSVRSYSGTRKIFDTLAKRNGFFGKIHFHTLRHTYSNMLFEMNENPKIIQALLGHKSVKQH